MTDRQGRWYDKRWRYDGCSFEVRIMSHAKRLILSVGTSSLWRAQIFRSFAGRSGFSGLRRRISTMAQWCRRQTWRCHRKPPAFLKGVHVFFHIEIRHLFKKWDGWCVLCCLWDKKMLPTFSPKMFSRNGLMRWCSWGKMRPAQRPKTQGLIDHWVDGFNGIHSWNHQDSSLRQYGFLRRRLILFDGQCRCGELEIVWGFLVGTNSWIVFSRLWTSGINKNLKRASILAILSKAIYWHDQIQSLAYKKHPTDSIFHGEDYCIIMKDILRTKLYHRVKRWEKLVAMLPASHSENPSFRCGGGFALDLSPLS